jgi:hypothetical protein
MKEMLHRVNWRPSDLPSMIRPLKAIQAPVIIRKGGQLMGLSSLSSIELNPAFGFFNGEAVICDEFDHEKEGAWIEKC